MSIQLESLNPQKKGQNKTEEALELLKRWSNKVKSKRPNFECKNIGLRVQEKGRENGQTPDKLP